MCDVSENVTWIALFESTILIDGVARQVTVDYQDVFRCSHSCRYFVPCC
jgi:hypothetical protein